MRAVMALSGGMDSTGLLIRLLAEGYKVSCISYEYGQKHNVELERACANIEYLAENGIEVEHRIADLSSAMGLFHSALTSEDIKIPEGHYEEEQMKSTVVPNRNAIFSSIVYGYALSIALKEDNDVIIALGVHSGDHAIYPDCRPEFYKSISHTINLGSKIYNEYNIKFTIKTPIINLSKKEIILLARKISAPLDKTWSCYQNEPTPCQKCDSCILRAKGFKEAQMQDPIL
jgi:7-cyano-7-deazaguanine synthase